MLRIGLMRGLAGTVAAALVTLALTGCWRGSGVNAYESMKQAEQKEDQSRQDLAGSLQAQGIKLEKKKYPLGEAWAVDLRGANVTDEILTELSKLVYVSELNLSKTNVTDAHLTKMNELKLLRYCLKLDLSNTAVTDAGLDSLTFTLGGLSDLYLTGTKATPAAVERLKKRRLNDPNVPKMFKNSTKAYF